MFSDDEYWYIVMEVARGGELYDRLTSEGVMQKWEIRSYLRQLAGAVEHIHKRGIVHCDIKPENVLLQDPQPMLSGETLDVEAAAAAAAAAALEKARTGGCPDVGNETPLFREKGESAPPGGMANRLMLADFGSSFRLDRGVTGESIDEQRPVKEYTAAYSAPEVVLDGIGDKKADIWSLGVIAYVMVRDLWRNVLKWIIQLVNLEPTRAWKSRAVRCSCRLMRWAEGTKLGLFGSASIRMVARRIVGRLRCGNGLGSPPDPLFPHSPCPPAT